MPKFEQAELFTKNTIKQINIYHHAPKSESYGAGFNVKFTPTQKEALKNIMQEHNIPASTFLREAMDVYIELFPLRGKLKKHKRLLHEILATLP